VLQLKKAVENMRLGVTVVDLNGRIRYCNPAEARMHGYTPDELIGRDVGEMAPPELRKPMTLEKVRRWNGLIRESTNIRKDGSRFPVWLMSEIVKDADGEPTAIVTSCEDITERKKAQEELDRHREHLEDLVRERTAELTTANEQLQQEIAERTRVETELRATYQNLKHLNDRLQDELLLARKIQQSLLPPPEPQWHDVDVVCYSTPAYEVGGDFYAYHAFEEINHPNGPPERANLGQYALAVGDVSGKGMPAALLMAISLASFQESIGQRLEPAVLLEHLDETIMPYTTTTIQNCALAYLEMSVPNDTQAGVARVVNAGCITPIVCRLDGTVQWVDVRGMPLGSGWGRSLGYEEVLVTLTRGDMIILISDGVVEARNPKNDLLGFERFEGIVHTGPRTSASDMMAHLQSELVAFMGSAELSDDLTLVVVRV
jgi:PAS domain S-box-containing protein